MTIDELKLLVREYLDAEREASSPPCLNRYRGAVRTREIARRNRKWRELHDQLSKAVGWTP